MLLAGRAGGLGEGEGAADGSAIAQRRDQAPAPSDTSTTRSESPTPSSSRAKADMIVTMLGFALHAGDVVQGVQPGSAEATGQPHLEPHVVVGDDDGELVKDRMPPGNSDLPSHEWLFARRAAPTRAREMSTRRELRQGS